MRVIGLMSGTSADAVDAALVEWPDGEAVRPFRLLQWREEPLPAALQQRIHDLAGGRLAAGDVLAELASLDVELGERFAAAAAALAEEAGVALAQVDAVASHGQTVAHHPERRATLQIGDPSVIAERTGCTTVADFRPRDLAAGGEGAPLAPFFHHAALSGEGEDRVVLNLGGIANVTWLPGDGDADAVRAFDVGPANALLDGVVSLWTAGRARLDRDGARAAAGRVRDGWLDALLDDDYLRRPPPKSTGRERYGLAEAEAWVARARREEAGLEDLLATLVAFAAEAVARALRDFLPRPPARVLLGGGGARNPVLVEALRARLGGAAVEPTDATGVPADAVEAMAFSLMGRNALLGLPNHLPRCTGAAGPRVLGELVPGGRPR
ncbi:MAG: anhydro-N-acetylmuramic acid kinase [Myxococcota bacterium]|nr:anhydro-N-acetylmuramic acid kinase [Myxococcota bacterium]